MIADTEQLIEDLFHTVALFSALRKLLLENPLLFPAILLFFSKFAYFNSYSLVHSSNFVAHFASGSRLAKIPHCTSILF